MNTGRAVQLQLSLSLERESVVSGGDLALGM